MTTTPAEPTMDAVARGGPVDGSVLGLADTERYEVVMADRSRWEYAATTERETRSDGTVVVTFDCRGRC